MRTILKSTVATLAFGVALAATPAGAVVIGNGSIFLGVNADASLNDTDGIGPSGRRGVGLFDGRTFWEATYDGCTCEAWGAGDRYTATAVWANTVENGLNASSDAGASVTGFNFTPFSAISVVEVDGTSAFRVVHNFVPSATPDLYQVNVSITNLGSSAMAPVYRRAMDWDIEPTPFEEYVTIGGVRDSAGNPHPNILFSSDDGFASGNPFAGESSIDSATVNTNFFDNGPTDHGALFDFQFDDLAAGDTLDFKIFYGASSSESAARAALAAVGAEIFSFGQARDSIDGGPGDPSTRLPSEARGDGEDFASTERSTFIFAFDIDNDGSSFASPLLPTGIRPDGGFEFRTTVLPGERIVIDPDVAIGYDYTFTGALATTVELEDLGDVDGYDIFLLTDLLNPIISGFMPGIGNIFDFTPFAAAGVDGFRIGDIDVALGLDPLNPLAFKTGLTFAVNGPTTIDITQTPLTVFVGGPGPIPEPATWAMMILGFGMTGAALRRRRHSVAVRFA